MTMKKTNVVVFNKLGKLLPTKLFLQGAKVIDSSQYKYLGLIFTNSGKFSVAKKDLLQRAFKGMYKITSMFKDAKPNYNICVNLFEHLVNPILLYGADVWGDTCFISKGSLYKLKD